LVFWNKNCIFAATVPATPLLESVPRQDFVFYKGSMQYTKQAMDFDCQLHILKERGLTVENEEDALKFLHSVSYFRFANYLQPMEQSTESHQFLPNSSFTFATKLYVFDRELRSLVFTAIQDIEIAFRTRIIHYFSMEHGPFWFMDSNKFKNQNIFNSCLDNIAAEVNRSREDFIAEYYSNYTAPSFPPAWKTLEVVSFGTLSKLFCNFKDNSVKKKVAKEFKLPLYLYLENWIKCIAVLRNACAHHARIWNRRFPTMPIMPEYLPSSWVVIGNFRPNKLYHQLCCLAYLEQSIAANGNFSKRLLVLMEKNENINTRSMGFPQEWKNEPLWNM
jgi:abortive infection bacteriophage resistance protein